MWPSEDRSEEIGPCVVTAKPCVSTKLSISSWTRWTALFPASVGARSSAATPNETREYHCLLPSVLKKKKKRKSFYPSTSRRERNTTQSLAFSFMSNNIRSGWFSAGCVQRSLCLIMKNPFLSFSLGITSLSIWSRWLFSLSINLLNLIVFLSHWFTVLPVTCQKMPVESSNSCSRCPQMPCSVLTTVWKLNKQS